MKILKITTKIIICILLVLLIIYILINMAFSAIFGSEVISQKQALKIFENNKKNIKEIEIGLENEEEIFIDVDKKIKIIGENNMFEEIPNQQYEKYDNIINLMNEAKIISISKNYSNIMMLVGRAIRFGQYIVKINGEERLNWGYHVTEKIHLEDNWYYIETT